MAATDPTNAFYREELAAAELRIGDMLSLLGEPAAAASAWTRTVEVLAAFASEPEKPDGYIWELYALASLRLDRIDEARPLVERLRDGGWPRTPLGAELAELCRRHGLPAAD